MAQSNFDMDFGAEKSGSMPTYPKKVMVRMSAPSSINSADVRNGRHGVMAKCLHKQVAANQWLDPPRDEDGNLLNEFVATRGMVIQREDGSYVTYPHTLNEEIVKATLKLDVPIAFSMSSEIPAALLSQIALEQTQLGDPRSGIVLPIIDSIEQIASAEAPITRNQFICLCKHEQFVLVWGDTVENIVQQGSGIETWLVGLVWETQVQPSGMPSPRHSSSFGMRALANMSPPPPGAYNTPMTGFATPPIMMNEKQKEQFDVIQTAIAKEEEGDKAYDPEKDGTEIPHRPLLLWHAGVIGLAMVLVVIVEFACIAKLLTEVRLDGSYIRFG